MKSISALFVGGTSGIGQSMAFKLASYCAEPHFIISGRSLQSAQYTLSKLKTINPAGTYEFSAVDMSRLKKVKDFANNFRKQHQKLNFLVISSGFLSLSGRTETEEGIDQKLAVHYYGRFLLINELIPLLEKAAELDEEARILSILAAGKASTPVPFDDMELKRGYSLIAAAEHATLYNDLMVESFSSRHSSISFMHAYPGFVATSIMDSLPFYARLPAKALTIFATSSDDCADYMLYGLTNKQNKKGWYLLNEKGEVVQKTKFHTEEARLKVWQHSVDMMNNVFNTNAK